MQRQHQRDVVVCEFRFANQQHLIHQGVHVKGRGQLTTIAKHVAQSFDDGGSTLVVLQQVIQRAFDGVVCECLCVVARQRRVNQLGVELNGGEWLVELMRQACHQGAHACGLVEHSELADDFFPFLQQLRQHHAVLSKSFSTFAGDSQLMRGCDFLTFRNL